jgi:outer membrane protein OmpA-like peptidoglycan-associated protein
VVIKELKSGVIVNTIRLPLLPAEQQKMASVTIADPWADVITGNKEIIIPEKVYFEVNDFKITKEGSVILDKVVRIMKTEPKIRIEVSSHTDAQGSAAYNLELSKKRAKSALDYMTAQGIESTRITGIGYGETKLINKCAEGVTCTEEEHAQNRRLEFKITYSK